MGSRLSQAVKKLSSIADLNDVFTFGGIGLLAYGFWAAWPPLGWIVFGGLLFLIGYRR